MTIEEIRRQNILYWAEKLGRNALAEKIGYRDTIYLNALCGGHGSFGKNTARKIEKALGLSTGWFDQDHHPDINQNKIDQIVERIKGLDETLLDEVMAQIEMIERLRSGR